VPSRIKSIAPIRRQPVRERLNAPASVSLGTIAMNAHQQKTFPSGRNGCVTVDTLRLSSQRHPGGKLLHARHQYHVSCCISPSDRSFAVSSRSFSGAPESTCSYGGAFRTLRDLTIRIVEFWRSRYRCAALWETWCRILKAVVLSVP
jgi:hypothetical protein